MSNEYRKSNNCPYCNHFCDAATGIEDVKAFPKPGDLSICIQCAEVGCFDSDMVLIKFDLNTLKSNVEKAFIFRVQARTRYISKLTSKRNKAGN